MPQGEKLIYEEGCKFEEIKQLTEKTISLLEERGFTKLMPV